MSYEIDKDLQQSLSVQKIEGKFVKELKENVLIISEQMGISREIKRIKRNQLGILKLKIQ